MSLLTIVQQVADEINIPRPTSVINNSNTQAIQLLALTNASGKRMLKRYDWQELIKEWTYSALAAEDQGEIQGTIITDSDWERFVGRTIYNRDQNRRIRGPYSPQEWQRDKGTVSSTVQEYFRLRGGQSPRYPRTRTWRNSSRGICL